MGLYQTKKLLHKETVESGRKYLHTIHLSDEGFIFRIYKEQKNLKEKIN
jgi:hypothetical protein